MGYYPSTRGGFTACPVLVSALCRGHLSDNRFSVMRYPRFLTVAGSDSGGGAGIQADIKTASALGCYAMTTITALTAQNTRGVTAIHAVPVDILKAQIEAVLDDIGTDVLKIGMLHAPEVVDVVAWAIRHYDIRKVVLDPVMVSANGDPLITPETVDILVRELFPLGRYR